MTDDIVTRLQAMIQWCEIPRCEGCEVETEAIDEIKRLRVEIKTLKASIEEVSRERDRWMGQTF